MLPKNILEDSYKYFKEVINPQKVDNKTYDASVYEYHFVECVQTALNINKVNLLAYSPTFIHDYYYKIARCATIVFDDNKKDIVYVCISTQRDPIYGEAINLVLSYNIKKFLFNEYDDLNDDVFYTSNEVVEDNILKGGNNFVCVVKKKNVTDGECEYDLTYNFLSKIITRLFYDTSELRGKRYEYKQMLKLKLLTELNQKENKRVNPYEQDMAFINSFIKNRIIYFNKLRLCQSEFILSETAAELTINYIDGFPLSTTDATLNTVIIDGILKLANTLSIRVTNKTKTNKTKPLSTIYFKTVNANRESIKSHVHMQLLESQESVDGKNIKPIYWNSSSIHLHDLESDFVKKKYTNGMRFGVKIEGIHIRLNFFLLDEYIYDLFYMRYQTDVDYIKRNYGNDVLTGKAVELVFFMKKLEHKYSDKFKYATMDGLFIILKFLVVHFNFNYLLINNMIPSFRKNFHYQININPNETYIVMGPNKLREFFKNQRFIDSQLNEPTAPLVDDNRPQDIFDINNKSNFLFKRLLLESNLGGRQANYNKKEEEIPTKPLGVLPAEKIKEQQLSRENQLIKEQEVLKNYSIYEMIYDLENYGSLRKMDMIMSNDPPSVSK